MNIETILNYFNGKKTYIGAIALVTLPFLALKGIIDADTASYLSTVLGIILGTAKLAGGRFVGNALIKK